MIRKSSGVVGNNLLLRVLSYESKHHTSKQTYTRIKLIQPARSRSRSSSSSSSSSTGSILISDTSTCCSIMSNNNNNTNSTNSTNNTNSNRRIIRKNQPHHVKNNNNNNNSITNSFSSKAKTKVQAKTRNKQMNETDITKRSIEVETLDMTSFISSTATSSSVTKYKIHKPQCSCPKIQNLSKQNLVFNIANTDTNINTNTTNTTNTNKNHHHNKLDGLVMVKDNKIINSVFLCLDSSKDKIDTITTDNTTTTTNTTPTENTKTLLSYEKQLYNKIHSSLLQLSTTTNNHNNTNNEKMKIKVSCAQCLLFDEPNGFICLYSTNKTKIEDIIYKANQNKEYKLQQQQQQSQQELLHADHADYVCAIPLPLLDSISFYMHKSKDKYKGQGKSNSKGKDNTSKGEDGDFAATNLHNLKQQFFNLIHDQQDIPRDKCESNNNNKDDDDDDDDDEKYIEEDIKLGHHLTSILILTKNNSSKVKDYDAKSKTKTKRTNIYIMAMLTKTQSNKSNQIIWEVDIPGGKRHLGERTIDCAIRETEEETSLVVDKSWICGSDSNNNNGDGHDDKLFNSIQLFRDNQYYFLTPPDDSNNLNNYDNNNKKENDDTMLESVMKDPFWTNTGGLSDHKK